MRQLLRTLAALAACVVLAYAGQGFFHYFQETTANRRVNRLMRQAVTERQPQAVDDASEAPAAGETTEPVSQEPAETAPIQVDFDALQETCEDVIGWLYCPDTPIDLPVVQAADNDYYLRRLPDGSWNNAGSLFADYRAAGDFSDGNTVIYGHNMRDKTMFGTLYLYGEQEYYDEHPSMWLLTPDGDYRVDLAAGFVTNSQAQIYYPGQSTQTMQELVQEALAASTFQTDLELTDRDRYLILSTCSYEFEEARYVVIGRLEALG